MVVGGAAAAAAFAGIVGTGIAIAAAQNRRDYYDGYGYYGGAPAYYGGGPAYYGSPGYYAARVTMAAVTIARACPTIAGIPSPAGNLRPPLKPLFKMNPPAAPAGGFFMVAGPAVNTPATAFH